MSRRGFVLLSSVFFVLFIGIFFTGFHILSKKIDSKLQVARQADVEHLTGSIDYSPLVGRLMHSVVNIEVTSVDEISNPILDMLKNLPFNGVNLNEFLKQKKIKKKFKHIGSGFYFKDGYIITNSHVIEKAREVKVKDQNDKEYEAKIVGVDQITDIGVLKIDTKNDLQATAIGNSADIKIGEVVITIGNPFNLPNTVTTGIISAKDRKLENPLVAYIQTDSAINKGNSGGPMFNLKGEVIGINTLIITQNGGNIGLGFAIPSNLVLEVAEKLIKNGKIIRAKAGIMCRDIPSDINLQKALKIKEGALILNLDRKSHAYRSGLKKGDVVIEINDKKIADFRDLAYTISTKKPGDKVNLKVLRHGKKMNFTIELKKRDEDDANNDEDGKNTKMIKGILVSNQEDDELLDSNIQCKKQGVLVKDIENEYILEDDSFLLPGDIVYQINENPIYDINSFERAVKEVDKYGLFYIKRDNLYLINGVRVE